VDFFRLIHTTTPATALTATSALQQPTLTPGRPTGSRCRPLATLAPQRNYTRTSGRSRLFTRHDIGPNSAPIACLILIEPFLADSLLLCLSLTLKLYDILFDPLGLTSFFGDEYQSECRIMVLSESGSLALFRPSSGPKLRSCPAVRPCAKLRTFYIAQR
jgi:hypothetical protein